MKKISLIILCAILLTACGGEQSVQKEVKKAKDLVIAVNNEKESTDDSKKIKEEAKPDSDTQESQNDNNEEDIENKIARTQSSDNVVNKNAEVTQKKEPEVNQDLSAKEEISEKVESSGTQDDTDDKGDDEQSGGDPVVEVKPDEPISGEEENGSSASESSGESASGEHVGSTPDGWISDDGYYHRSDFCNGHVMTGEVMMWHEAKENGYLPCPDCSPS